MNIQKYGVFDVVFCCGLLYHLDQPKQFLEAISSVTTKLTILQTHFSTDTCSTKLFSLLPALGKKILAALTSAKPDRFHLSRVSENEGLRVRWYMEFANDESFSKRETSRWASRDNRRAFWIQREYLLQTIKDVGFDLVLEPFDSLEPSIAESVLRAYYHTDRRGTFIGIKTLRTPAKFIAG